MMKNFIDACKDGDWEAFTQLLPSTSKFTRRRGIETCVGYGQINLIETFFNHAQDDDLLVSGLTLAIRENSAVIIQKLKILACKNNITITNPDPIFSSLLSDICYNKGKCFQLVWDTYPEIFTEQICHQFLIAGIVYNCPNISKMLVHKCDVTRKDSQALFLSCRSKMDELSEMLYPLSDPHVVLKNMIADECTDQQMLFVRTRIEAQKIKEELQQSTNASHAPHRIRKI